MRILFILCDMLRADLLKKVNPKITKATEFDKYLHDFGGTLYTNCYTPAPDTPRSLACLYTGLYPKNNGCKKRIQWPKYYLNNKCQNIYNLFIENGYDILARNFDHYINTGFFPEEILDKIDYHEDLIAVANKINENKNENLFSFIYLPDYHWVVNKINQRDIANPEGQKHLINCFKQLFNICDVDSFDHIFIFSDHGCMFKEDAFTYLYERLGDERSKIVMFWHKKNDDYLVQNNELRSIMDVFPTIKDLLGNKNSYKIDGISFCKEIKNRKIAIEDHSKFAPSIESTHDLWAVKTDNYFYFETLEKSFLQSFNYFEQDKETEIVKAMKEFLKTNTCSYENNIKQHEILQYYNTLNLKAASRKYFSDGEEINLISDINESTNVFRKIIRRFRN